MPAAQRESYTSVASGAMVQNVYLYCALAGLATVIRSCIDRHALARAMKMGPDHQSVLTQAIGYQAGLNPRCV